MILTAADIATYAPTVTLTEPALIGAIALAQAQVEGIRGANRKLEIADYNEIYKVKLHSQTCRLCNFPVESITSLQGRVANVRAAYGQQTGVTDWIDIESDQYVYDESDRQINLNQGFSSYLFSFYGFNFRGSRNNQFVTEVKVNYRAGFDFTDDNNSEVILIKSLLGQILTYQQTNGLNKGISRKQIDDEYSVTYSNSSSGGGRDRVGAGVGQVPDSMLELFYKYRTQTSPVLR